MAEIGVYPRIQTWEQVLRRNFQGAGTRWRCVVQSAKKRVEEARTLVKNEGDIFLNHGTKADGSADRQPIWRTEEPIILILRPCGFS